MSGYDDDREERGVAVDPDVDDRSRWWPGVAALALFAVLAWVFVGAEFGQPAGFPDGAEITASIGYAMLNIEAPDAVPSEGFLVALIVIAVVLDAALDGAVLLASREEDGEITTALRSDAVEQERSSQEVVPDGGERSSASRTSKDESFGSERTDGSGASSDRPSDGGERSSASRTSTDERGESLGSREVDD